MRNGFNVAAVSVCALALAACGGSGGGQPKAEVVAKANAICRQFDKDTAGLGKQTPKTPDEYVQVLGQLEPVATRLVDQLDALQPSGPDSEPFKRFIEVSRTQIQLLGEMQDAITAGDRARLQTASAGLDSADVRSNIAAQQYGMNDCVSNS
jgi:hypothetical protein